MRAETKKIDPTFMNANNAQALYISSEPKNLKEFGIISTKTRYDPPLMRLFDSASKRTIFTGKAQEINIILGTKNRLKQLAAT